MRTDEGDEIIEPGDYELGDGKNLRVYLTEDDNRPEGEQVQMWACTHCQEVDGITNGILVGVIDGTFTLDQDATGEFRMSLTEAGKDTAKRLIERLGGDDPQSQVHGAVGEE